jgi:hypothetical protein
MRCKFNKKINKSYQNFGFFLIYLQKRYLLTLLYKKNETKKGTMLIKNTVTYRHFSFRKRVFGNSWTFFTNVLTENVFYT